MKQLLVILLLVVGAGQVVAGDILDQHVTAEGAYWLNGVPNDHQRYSALCGVFRQDAEKRPIAVVYVISSDEKKNEIIGEPIGMNNNVVSITTDDMDYIYGALAISRACAEIPVVLTEATARAIQGSDSGLADRLMGDLILGPDDETLIIEE